MSILLTTPTNLFVYRCAESEFEVGLARIPPKFSVMSENFNFKRTRSYKSHFAKHRFGDHCYDKKCSIPKARELRKIQIEKELGFGRTAPRNGSSKTFDKSKHTSSAAPMIIKNSNSQNRKSIENHSILEARDIKKN